MEYKGSYFPSNKSFDWIRMDNEDKFNRNFSKFKSLEYYKKNPIEYNYNNFGFRTPDDFNDTDEGNVFLGCSDTMGIGHLLENTWAYKVNKEVGGKFWNLSQGGCGIQTDYRLLYGWKETLKIKNIFHFTHPHPRFEFFDEDGEFFRMAPWDDNQLKNVNKFYLDYLSGEEYCNYNQEIYINAIKGLSQDIGCNYYYLTADILSNVAKPFQIAEVYGIDLKRHKTMESIPSRDIDHLTVGQQNFIYEELKRLWQE